MAGYGEQMEDIHRYIDDHMESFVKRLQAYLRIPSVAAHNLDQEKCAKWVHQQFADAGFDVCLDAVDGGPPVVTARKDNPDATKSLLFYGHYDVQPPDPVSEWIHDPFGAEIQDGRIYARGAVDEKGGGLAALLAAEAFLNVRGNLPVSMRFVLEGEEEVGSPHFGRWAEGQVDFLRVDGCFTLDGSVNYLTNQPLIRPMERAGILFVELHCQSANRDVYSAEAHYVPNSAWRLTWALATLKDENEVILIDGWYDHLLRPSEEDLELLREFPFDADLMAKGFGIIHLLGGYTGYEPLIARWYEPTCSICGIQSGYTGQGMMTKVPSHAFAKIDFRIKAGMEPDRHVKLLRRHLDKHGFSDIEIKVISAKNQLDSTPRDSVIVEAARRAAQNAFDKPPLVFPGLSAPNPYPNGSYEALGPGSLADLGTGVMSALGVPWIQCYYGDAESYNHSPNEFLSIEAFRRTIKYAAGIIDNFAQI
jgi:acetylornithine deacetylase/succinyl-diaminopimelate desuccinylase-like protein